MRLGFAVLAACVTVTSLAASGGPPVDVASRARGAARVVVARVADVHARFDVNQWGDRIIVSQAQLEVEDALKGPRTAVLPVDVEGGTVGDLTLKVSDIPTLEPGDRAVFFLDAAVTASGAYRPHRRGLGVMKLDSGNRVAGSTVTLDDIKASVRTALR
jgi:hypothetical protein